MLFRDREGLSSWPRHPGPSVSQSCRGRVRGTLSPLRPARTSASQLSCCLRPSWVRAWRRFVCLVIFASFAWIVDRRAWTVAVIFLSMVVREVWRGCFGCMVGWGDVDQHVRLSRISEHNDYRLASIFLHLLVTSMLHCGVFECKCRCTPRQCRDLFSNRVADCPSHVPSHSSSDSCTRHLLRLTIKYRNGTATRPIHDAAMNPTSLLEKASKSWRLYI
jgi:hypothetical protein